MSRASGAPLSPYTVLDSTEPTPEDISSSEAESSDEGDSISSNTSASVRRPQNIRRRFSIEEFSKQRASQTCSTTPDRAGPTSDCFFSTVCPAGFPVSNTKVQPWKTHWSQLKQPLCNRGTQEMIVLCPARWDYGSNGLGGY